MAPRVVVIGLASDFGCQVQMTNMEDDLLDVLGLIELVVLAARVERAHARRVRRRRHRGRGHDRRARGAAASECARRPRRVIAIGACAVTGGIPALAGRGDLDDALRGASTATAAPRSRAGAHRPAAGGRGHRRRLPRPGLPHRHRRVPARAVSARCMGLSDKTPRAADVRGVQDRARTSASSSAAGLPRARHAVRVRREVRDARPAVHRLPRASRRTRTSRPRGRSSPSTACDVDELRPRARAVQHRSRR